MARTLLHLMHSEPLRCTTINVARTLGIEATRGTPKIGKIADMALCQTERPGDLTYGIGVNPCTAVVKSGRLVDLVTFCCQITGA